eukprot:COSAG01_NODE_2061_length_8482_cov_6.301925_3_plen_102_part_00
MSARRRWSRCRRPSRWTERGRWAAPSSCLLLQLTTTLALAQLTKCCSAPRVIIGQVGVLQRLSLPPVGWDDGDGDARHTQSGLVLSPHTVEVRELAGLLRY